MLPGRRARLSGLADSEKGRRKLRGALPHLNDLDPRFASRVPEQQQSAVDIEKLLRRAGSGETCNVFSEDPDEDAVEAELGQALRQVVGGGLGAIVVCVPGRLAYYEGEESGERYVLKRED